MASRSGAEENGKKQARFIGEFMNLIDAIEKQQLRTDLPSFKPGDTVKVHVKIKEGDKERIQVFEGVCIGLKHGGVRATFTVRKISFGHGVERIFPMHSKVIDKVEVVRAGRVRRAKLYYIRELRGKAARIKEVKAAQ
jgi:large subunit ribosomal protein L19